VSVSFFANSGSNPASSIAMNPDEYCRQKAAASGSNAYYAFLFLPPGRRHALTALHAFRRELEDIVDECSDAQLAQTKLAWWRGEVGKLVAGSPSHPVTKALLASTEKLSAQVRATPMKSSKARRWA